MTLASSVGSKSGSKSGVAGTLSHSPNLNAQFSPAYIDTGPFPEQLWLLSCVEKQRFATKLEHFDADSQKIRSDMDLALMVRQQYSTIRPRWKRLLRLRGLCTIQFIQVIRLGVPFASILTAATVRSASLSGRGYPQISRHSR
jgi:hypothetical protein